MDDEFHYYITFIIALTAGFDHRQAYRIAYSSQYVDDNTRQYTIHGGSEGPYRNYITQTPDIFKPQEDLMRIYPVFHFMPGDSNELHGDLCRRQDGKLHLLNTVAGNSHSTILLQSALASGNDYLAGIATHVFADTFSHQNFVGYKDSFNGMDSLFAKIAPSIGHLDAQHRPDWPAAIWDDCRLVTSHRKVRNRDRVIDASKALYNAYASVAGTMDEGTGAGLVDRITKALGPDDPSNDRRHERIDRYRALIGPAYRPYDKDEWRSAAVTTTLAGPVPPQDDYPALFPSSLWTENYHESDWYRFQEAARLFQKDALSRILNPLFAAMELTGL